MERTPISDDPSRGAGTQARHLRLVKILCRIAAILLAATTTWLNRFQMNADGVSYLDIGDYYFQGNWHAALNAYWSPLYSWLTGLTLWIARPGIRWEFPTVHILNLAIFLTLLLSFEFFLRELSRSAGNGVIQPTDRPQFWILSYSLLIYLQLVVDSVLSVSPDLLMTALVYLSLGFVLRIVRTGGDKRRAALLGLLLGLAYLAKSPMLPFGLVLLFTLFLALKQRPHRFSILATALAVLLAIAMPVVIALSLMTGHFTFGESARMNQGWKVNGMKPEYRFWLGTGEFHPAHAPRVLSEKPLIFEFSSPVPGTYPIWFDPACWNRGMDTGFHPARQLRTFAHNLAGYGRFLIFEMPLATVALLLLCLTGGKIPTSGKTGQNLRTRVLGYWPVLVPVGAVFLMYALVFWEFRYLAGFATALASIVVASHGWNIPGGWARNAITAALAFCVLVSAIVSIRHTTTMHRNDKLRVEAAEKLRDFGLRPGDSVAVIGDGLTADWARLAKLRIVAELPERNFPANAGIDFATLNADEQARILALFRRTGAKAVVAEATTVTPGWRLLGDSGQEAFVLVGN